VSKKSILLRNLNNTKMIKAVKVAVHITPFLFSFEKEKGDTNNFFPIIPPL